MKRYIIKTLISSVVLSVSLSSCFAKKAQDNSVVFRCSGGWYTPPAFHGNSLAQGGDGTHIHFIYDSLFFFVPKTEEMIPRLGVSVEDKEPDSLTIKVREGVLWHDGSPFNAYDVKSSFLILYLQGWGGNLNDIEIIDNYTVKFHWKHTMTTIEKRNIMLEKLRAPNHLYGEWVKKAEIILAKAREINKIAYENWTERENKINADLQLQKSEVLQEMYKYRPDLPVGTGAFKVTHVSASEMELTKYDKSWSAKDVSVDKVKLLRGPSNDVLWAFLIAGDVDASHPATPEDVAEQILALNDKTKIVTPSDYGEFGFLFNTKKAPMSDINFRKAIAHLIDKDTVRMVSSYYSKTSDTYNIPVIGSIEDRWLNKSFLNTLESYDHSVEKAAEILEKAGYKKDEYGFYTTPSGDPIKLEIASIAGYSDWVLASESFATQLSKFGIQSNVRTLEASYFHQQLQNNQFDIASNFGSDFKMYAHPATSFGRFFDTNGYIKRASGLPDILKDKQGKNIVLQKQFEQMVNSQSKNAIEKPLKTLSEISNQYLPFIPIYEKNLTVFVVDGERVSGWPDKNDPIWTSSSSGLEGLYSYLISSGTVHKADGDKNEIK